MKNQYFLNNLLLLVFFSTYIFYKPYKGGALRTEASFRYGRSIALTGYPGVNGYRAVPQNGDQNDDPRHRLQIILQKADPAHHRLQDQAFRWIQGQDQ